jgi:hypothetical protein
MADQAENKRACILEETGILYEPSLGAVGKWVHQQNRPMRQFAVALVMVKQSRKMLPRIFNRLVVDAPSVHA